MPEIIIEEIQTGTVLKAGTSWPRKNQLVRDERPGSRPTWQIVEGIENGVPSRVREFGTLHEARAAWDRLTVRMSYTSGT